MPMEEVMDSAAPGDKERNLESLPTELLVYIVSFLPTIREKAKLRYVLRSVGEASSLWSEFVWPQFDSREELCVKNLLDMWAHHVRRICFPDHVRLSVLLKPLSKCCKLTHLSIPSAELAGLEPDQFRNALQHMEQLERLEVHWNSSISPLLLAGPPRLKELTAHASHSQSTCIGWVQDWVTNKFVPQNLSIIIEEFVSMLHPKLLEAWPLWNSFIPAERTAELRLYSGLGFKVPLNLFNALPMFQLHFSQTAMLPFVKVATFGLLSMEPRLLMLTDQNSTTHKAEFVANANLVIHDDQLDHHVTSLSFITNFDASRCKSVHPDHLEQLAVACPNLQRLNLSSKYECLESLQGLRMIASCCHSLQGLHLGGIGVSKVENHDCMQLWEILSSMQLTHLAVETCVLNPFTDGALLQQLAGLLQNFLSLKALECSDDEECRWCEDSKDSLLLCSFPSLVYCRVWMINQDSQYKSNFVQNNINNCEKLKYFNVQFSKSLTFSSLQNNSSLRQLCINSDHTILPDNFMKTISVHGGLTHVVLCVFSVTCSGIITLITNSPKLITLHVSTRQCDEDEFSLEITLKEKFPHRKLCTAGSYTFEKVGFTSIFAILVWLRDTDMFPYALWA